MTCKFCELVTGTAELPKDLSELCNKHIILVLREVIISMGDRAHLDFRIYPEHYINRLIDELEKRINARKLRRL